ncbi:hypothetical protein GGTG_06526 [Gaeumannomyces tritici R3-111a-1]|uniref:Uncharacterized protein n=1 Tax=Gaeumannomyces tritici (strain R3-111a-1) TaxID=644352 RepID=J3NZ26_GAET3|nr:hypothetical protein GGTG_06526 [Gaeumannomyces tritici R3-111a-1]EJT76609.1 hypothetical protein GGTG_06526 [Gaeumannomyces tritici R3-111a-1]
MKSPWLGTYTIPSRQNRHRVDGEQRSSQRATSTTAWPSSCPSYSVRADVVAALCVGGGGGGGGGDVGFKAPHVLA